MVARDHGRHFLGSELDPSYHAVAMRRLSGASRPSGSLPQPEDPARLLRADRRSPPRTYRFDVQTGARPTDRGLARIYPEEHHLNELEERLAREEAAFAAAIRDRPPP